MVATMNRQAPIGGVIRAMVMFRVKISPRCTGSTPAASATGATIGVSSISTETSSMSMPQTKITALMMNSIRVGEWPNGSSNWANSLATWA